MLSRLSLAIIITVFCAYLYAQVDSLNAVVEADTLAIPEIVLSKSEITQWLIDHRKDTTANVMDSSPLYADNGDLYRNGYYYIGRPIVSPAYRYGFEQPAGVFGAGLYHSYYHNLYNSEALNYNTAEYPFSPALTSIHAGIGDYEHHFARVSFKKNSLFSFPGVCYQGDLLVQNGQWTDIISAETSMKHYLSMHKGNYTLETEYASFAKDIAMTELQPVFWLGSNFLIAHQIKQLYASLKNPYAELSIINSRESATATPFAEKLTNNTTQLRISIGHDTGVHKYNAFYEHAFRDANIDFGGGFDADPYKHKLGLNWDSYIPIGIGFKADCLDWKRGRFQCDISIPVGSSYIGAFTNTLWGEDASPDSVLNIYDLTNYYPLLDQGKRREEGAYVRYEWQGISTQFTAGTKYIEQSAPLSGFNVHDEQLFVRLALDALHTWRNWELKAREQWIWTKAHESMCESPEYRFQSVQNLYYHLPWNNALVAGFAVNGHSGYYAANAVNPNLIEASSVLDAWAGFNIDAYFELRAGIKNAMSSTLYGAYPMPWALFVEIKWEFIN
ncbi:MAG: hypothetical protein RBS43_02720 [Candidatus Cloacimonas sp.]|jgi:hypothetical protein|nr:hypothetical protein [Candidatus Cloacimonas sp.]